MSSDSTIASPDSAGDRATGRRAFALVGAVLGWTALVGQLLLTVRVSVTGGHGVAYGLVQYLGFFTITTNIFGALVFTAWAVRVPWAAAGIFRRPWVITSAAASMIIVAVIYFILLRGLWRPEGFQLVMDVALHYVMPPLIVVFWWMAVPARSLRWTAMGGALAYPVAYLAYVFVRGALIGRYPYFFIDTTALGLVRALLNAAGVSLIFLAVLSLLILLNRYRTAGTFTEETRCAR